MKLRTVFTASMIAVASLNLYAQDKEEKIAEENLLKYSQQAASAVCSPEKKAAVEQFRDYFSRQAYRGFGAKIWREAYPEDIRLLEADGLFTDLKDSDAGKALSGNTADSGGSISTAYNRIWHISEAFRNGELTYEKDRETWRRCQKAIVHYGRLENRRPNDYRRFHASCFAIPTAAVNIYFCHLSQMDAVEKGEIKDEMYLLRRGSPRTAGQRYRNLHPLYGGKSPSQKRRNPGTL